MESLEPDPFAESFADHRWRGHELFPSVTHYYLALALDRSPSFVDETSDLACLWILMCPPNKVLDLEARIRRAPDAVYREIFDWIENEAPRPNSPEFFEAREMVGRLFRQVADAHEEVDESSIEGGDPDGMPGKSQGGQDIALASPVFSDSTRSTS